MHRSVSAWLSPLLPPAIKSALYQNHPGDAKAVAHHAKARREKVLAIGMETFPPSPSAAKTRSASASFATDREREIPAK